MSGTGRHTDATWDKLKTKHFGMECDNGKISQKLCTLDTNPILGKEMAG